MLPPAVAQPRCSVLNRAICELHPPMNVPVQTASRSRGASRGSQEGFDGLKNNHNSVNVENRPHIDINFFLLVKT